MIESTSQLIALIGFVVVLYLGYTIWRGVGSSHSKPDFDDRPRRRYIVDDDDRPPRGPEGHHGDK